MLPAFCRLPVEQEGTMHTFLPIIPSALQPVSRRACRQHTYQSMYKHCEGPVYRLSLLESDRWGAELSVRPQQSGNTPERYMVGSSIGSLTMLCQAVRVQRKLDQLLGQSDQWHEYSRVVISRGMVCSRPSTITMTHCGSRCECREKKVNRHLGGGPVEQAVLRLRWCAS
jgi:hypothetical protein